MRRTELIVLAGMAILLAAPGTAGATAEGGVSSAAPMLVAQNTDRTDPRQDPHHPVTQPPYPSDSFQRNEEGSVILKFLVRSDGSVDPSSVAVDQSSGFPSLDKAAMAEAAAKWHFLPATENGKPVAAQHRFRVVFTIDKTPGGATGTTIVRDPGMVSVKKKFVADATIGAAKDEKGEYQEGKADGVYYRFYGDGSATFQMNAPGTDSVGEWKIVCGAADGNKVCVARYYKLEVALVKDKGWLVSLIGQRMSVCPIAFIPKDKSQEPTALTVKDPGTGPAIFPDKDGTGIIKSLTEMDSFVAPCGMDNAIADPDMAMQPAPFATIRRYMQWIMNGQPAG